MTISPMLLLYENSQNFDFLCLYGLNFQHFWTFLVQKYNISSLFINSFWMEKLRHLNGYFACG